MSTLERRTDELSRIAVEVADHISQAKGEAKERDKQHQENLARLEKSNNLINRYGLMIAVLMLICAICTIYNAVRTPAPPPQKQTQAAPPSHSDLPPDFDSARSN